MGTVILTVTGLISRLIGFLYRIFLSRIFGASGMGIYQLTSPILALSFAITAAGMQTAISKYVAGETTTKNYRSSADHLVTGFVIAMSVSLACTWFIYVYADFLAVHFLLEARTAPLLRILSFSIPMATVHSCINGYFYGIRKAAVPALSQLAEQIVRVGSVFIIYAVCKQQGYTPTISFAVIGLVIGESAAMLVSIIAIKSRFNHLQLRDHTNWPNCRAPGNLTHYYTITRRLLHLAIPLSANRVIINFLASIEAVCIPNRLMAYGLSHTAALSIYGILTGMALPMILFPSAITNSICVLLLPVVSEADAGGSLRTIKKAVSKSIRYGLLLGMLCTAGFLLLGRPMGNYLFREAQAGTFIMALSFLCPLMYIASTLNSILNGLGKTTLTFCYSLVSLLLRLGFVFFLIPVFGIQGYLWGLLASQLLQTGLCLFSVRRYL